MKQLGKILCIAALAGLSQAGPYAAFTASGFIPFTTAGTTGVDWSSNVKVDLTVNSVASTARKFQPVVDTGTCGFLFNAAELPDWDPATEAISENAGWEFLSSSKLLYTGHWVLRDLYFNPRDASHVIKATVPVLAVTAKTNCTCYNVTIHTDQCPGDCSEELDTTGVRLMGVGFGREEDGQPQGTPDKNAFINIVSVAGQDMTRYIQGYKIDKMGITVGLTDANTASMSFQNLPARNPIGGGGFTPTIPRDYRSLRSHCISFNGGATCYSGEVLLDTGLGTASMRVPLGVSIPRTDMRLNTGAHVAVDLGDPALVTERFTVGTGIATGVTPDWVGAYNSARGNFFNTGRHVYRAWNTAYDSVNGRYGLEAV
jgi:hypothetical protein